jgi:hypothetical protein
LQFETPRQPHSNERAILSPNKKSTMAPRKYIFVNGVMKLNPEFGQATPGGGDTATAAAAVPDSAAASSASGPLQVISSLADVAQATDAQSDATGVPMQLADSTVQAIQNTQSDEYVGQFNVSPSNADSVLDGLTEAFIQYEVPIGMINKLQALAAYRLNFIIDDSGSMRYESLSSPRLSLPDFLSSALPH